MKWNPLEPFRHKPVIHPADAQRIMEALAREPSTNAQNLSPGDQIRVIEGPFQDLSGMIEVVDEDRGRLKVQIKVFGRNTPVELHFSQVEKLT